MYQDQNIASQVVTDWDGWTTVTVTGLLDDVDDVSGVSARPTIHRFTVLCSVPSKFPGVQCPPDGQSKK